MRAPGGWSTRVLSTQEHEFLVASLRIVHLCAPAHVGGLERVIHALAPATVRKGAEVSVVAVVEPGAEVRAFVAPLEAAGIPVEVIRVGARSYLAELRVVRRVVRALRPNLVHSHGYRSDLLHGGWARRAGIATVSTLHGSSRLGGRFSAFLEWWQEGALRRFDGVVAVSRPLRDELTARGVATDRIALLPNAWLPSEPREHPAFGSVRPGSLEVRIGWVGRLIPIKGGDVFLRAIASLEADAPWSSWIVGDGPERSELEALASSLGIRERVTFLGALEDAASIMHHFDLFVLSSHSEGTPMVLLESLGAGVPVVATAVGGVPGVVRDPEEGWLVAPGDPSSLAEALAEALKDPARRRARGEAGRVRVAREFDLDRWAEGHMDLYHRAVARRRSLRGTRSNG